MKRRFYRLRKEQPERIPDEFGELSKETHSDVNGSYTGNPLDDEMPEQDADDL